MEKTSARIKQPLIRIIWNGFRKYWKRVDLNLSYDPDQLFEVLKTDFDPGINEHSAWMMHYSPEEIERAVRQTVKEQCAGRGNRSSSNLIYLAMLLDLTDIVPEIKKGLTDQTFSDWEERYNSFKLLLAFEDYDDASMDIARKALKEDEDSDARRIAALLLAHSNTAADWKKVHEFFKEHSHYMASRCTGILSKLHEAGEDVTPVLDTFFEAFDNEDYPLLVRFTLSTKNQDIIEHLLNNGDSGYAAAFTRELYHKAGDYDFMFAKAQELADAWMGQDSMDDALTFLLAFIQVLAESEETREKYSQSGSWQVRAGIYTGMASYRTAEELEELRRGEDDSDVQELLDIIIKIVKGKKTGGVTVQSYLDALLLRYISENNFLNLSELILYAPHLPILEEIPVYEDFHMLLSEASYEEKTEHFTGRLFTLFQLIESGDNGLNLYSTTNSLLKQKEEEAAVVAFGTDSEVMRDYFETRFLVEDNYHEAHSFLTALKYSGEPVSRTAQIKERFHIYGPGGLTAKELNHMGHLMYRQMGANEKYARMFIEHSPHHFRDKPEHILYLIAGAYQWGNIDGYIDNLGLHALPPSDIPVVDDIRKLLSGRFSDWREIRSAHILPELLTNSRQLTSSVMRLLNIEEEPDNPLPYFSIVGDSVEKESITAFLSALQRREDFDSIGFFTETMAKGDRWQIRQGIADFLAGVPRAAYIPTVLSLLEDNDSDVRDSAISAFKNHAEIEPLKNRVFLLEQNNKDIEDVIEELKEKREELTIEKPESYKEKKVMIEIYSPSMDKQLAHKRTLSREEWEYFCLYMQVDYHDADTGNIITHIGDEESEQTVNVILEEKPLQIFVPSWV